MKNSFPRWTLYLTLFVLYLLHNDLWLWNDAGLFLGLPIGLFYHIMYCVAAAILMILLVKFAWPGRLEMERKEQAES